MNQKSVQLVLGAVKISIFVGVLVVLGLKACLVFNPEPEAEVVLPAVVAKMVDDYRPVDAIRELGPEDHDATLEWALDRYAVLLRQVGDSAIVLDSLRYRIARCEVR